MLVVVPVHFSNIQALFHKYSSDIYLASTFDNHRLIFCENVHPFECLKKDKFIKTLKSKKLIFRFYLDKDLIPK